MEVMTRTNRPVNDAAISQQEVGKAAHAEGVLAAASRSGLAAVRVESDGRGVRIIGSVPSFYEKQSAQELLMRSGIRVVANEARVVNAAGRP